MPCQSRRRGLSDAFSGRTIFFISPWRRAKTTRYLYEVGIKHRRETLAHAGASRHGRCQTLPAGPKRKRTEKGREAQDADPWKRGSWECPAYASSSPRGSDECPPGQVIGGLQVPARHWGSQRATNICVRQAR